MGGRASRPRRQPPVADADLAPAGAARAVPSAPTAAASAGGADEEKENAKSDRKEEKAEKKDEDVDVEVEAETRQAESLARFLSALRSQDAKVNEDLLPALQLAADVLAGPTKDGELREAARTAVLEAACSSRVGIALTLDALYVRIGALAELTPFAEEEAARKDVSLGACFTALAALLRQCLKAGRDDPWGAGGEATILFQAAVWDAAPAIRQSLGVSAGPVARDGASEVAVAVFQELGVEASATLLEGLEPHEISILFQRFADAEEESFEYTLDLALDEIYPEIATKGGNHRGGALAPTSERWVMPHVAEDDVAGEVDLIGDDFMQEILGEVGLHLSPVQEQRGGERHGSSPKLTAWCASPKLSAGQRVPEITASSLEDDLRALGIDAEFLPDRRRLFPRAPP